MPWCRYESDIQEVNGQQVPVNERVFVDHVYWEDFAHACERNWEDVRRKGWVARRVLLTRQEGVARFGDGFKDIPLNAKDDSSRETSLTSFDTESKDAKAEVWELWCAKTKTRKFLSLEHNDFLEQSEDPYGLEHFFPCPLPVWATKTNRSLIPIPDYLQYENLAEELDDVSIRIRKLTEELRLVGVYDASAEGIGKMLESGADGTLIPVTNMAGLLGKTGPSNTLNGVVQWLPMNMVLESLLGLYQARDQVKQTLYEVSGISDIVRGQVDPKEKATQSRLKSEYASLRMDKRRKAIEKQAQDVLQIISEMIAELFTEEALFEKSGFMRLPEFQGKPMEEVAMAWQEVVKLLKNQQQRDFEISVESDSMIYADVEEERKARNEFLNASGSFLQQAIPAVQAAPELGPLLGEMLLFTVRGYRAGRNLESRFEDFVEQLRQNEQEQQGQGPSPEEQMQQQQMEAAQMEMEMQQQEMQMKMMQTQIKTQVMQMEMQAKAEQLGIKLEMDKAQLQHDIQEDQIKLATLQGNLEATRRMHAIKIATAKANQAAAKSKGEAK